MDRAVGEFDIRSERVHLVRRPDQRGGQRAVVDHPAIMFLSMAVVGVRALALGRYAFRYLERLASHDAAFHQLADLRLGVFARIPVLPAAGLTLVLALLTAGLPAAVASSLLSARSELRLAPLRGTLAGEVLEVVENLDVLTAFGALDARLATLAAADDGLRRASLRRASLRGRWAWACRAPCCRCSRAWRRSALSGLPFRPCPGLSASVDRVSSWLCSCPWPCSRSSA